AGQRGAVTRAPLSAHHNSCQRSPARQRERALRIRAASTACTTVVTRSVCDAPMSRSGGSRERGLRPPPFHQLSEHRCDDTRFWRAGSHRGIQRSEPRGRRLHDAHAASALRCTAPARCAVPRCTRRRNSHHPARPIELSRHLGAGIESLAERQLTPMSHACSRSPFEYTRNAVRVCVFCRPGAVETSSVTTRATLSKSGTSTRATRSQSPLTEYTRDTPSIPASLVAHCGIRCGSALTSTMAEIIP